ncbi:hypothetical protein ABPG72_012016 [Tetrahymena utriculariae]
MLSLLGETFLNKDQEVGSSALQNIELIGLYFSAVWCGPCRLFTPRLNKFYQDINQDNKKMEVFFVSKDKNKEEFLYYYKHMPFLTIPFEDQQRIKHLYSFYRVMGIPTLVILDNKGRYITKEGKQYIETMGTEAYDTFIQMRNEMYSDIKEE